MRFCLDGPDFVAKFWANRCLPRTVFSKSVNGGGGVMMWGGMSWRGKTPLVIIREKMTSES